MHPRLRLTVLVSVSSLICGGGLPAMQRSQGRGAAPEMAITGRVVDPSGKPVADTFVTALQKGGVSGRPFDFVSARLGSLTNEKGEFHLEGLYAGEFYVIALPHNPPVDASGHPTRSGFGNTFYPGVRAFSDAKTVIVRPGLPGTADIALLPAGLSMTSGVVIGSSGAPVSGGTLLIARGDGLFGLDSRAVRISPRGTFGVAGLQPGTYFLVFRESQWPPPRGTIPKVSQAKVVISGADVPNMRVAPLTMVRATGRLVVDPAERALLDPSSVRVGPLPTPFDGNPGPSRYGTVGSDLTFEFGAWPIPARIRVMIESPGWLIKAVRHNGVDITDKTIDFVQGKEITGLEVVLTRGPTRR
jgi:hypothetical protein